MYSSRPSQSTAPGALISCTIQCLLRSGNWTVKILWRIWRGQSSCLSPPRPGFDLRPVYVTYVVLKVTVGGFCCSTSVFPHPYHATDAPHSTSGGRSRVTLKKITFFRKSGTMGRKGILYCLRSLQPALRLQFTIQQHSLTAGHDEPKRPVCVTFRADTTSVRRAIGNSNNAEWFSTVTTCNSFRPVAFHRLFNISPT